MTFIRYSLICLFLFPATVIAAPLNATRYYEVYWGGLHIGDLIAEIKETDKGTYRFETLMRSRHLSKLIANYRNHAISVIKAQEDKGFTPASVKYTTHFRKKERQVSVEFDKSGNILQENASPPFPPKKFTFATTEEKKGSIDPLTAALLIRQYVRNYRNTGIKPEKLSFLVYEGRQLYRLFATLHGKDNLKKTGQPVIHISLYRKAIAGFSKNELKHMPKQDPVIDIYLEDNDFLLPLQAHAKAPIGFATAKLKKSCSSMSECLQE